MKSNNLVGVAGDWHGNDAWALKVIDELAARNVHCIFQVGDFGFWPGRQGIRYLDKLEERLAYTNTTLYAVMGNHDWNSEWRKTVIDCQPENRDPIAGGAFVRSHIVLMPVTTNFTMGDDERKFVVAGGAVSIDRHARIAGLSYWPEEILTDSEVDGINDDRCDVLLTHDAAYASPFPFRLLPDAASYEMRERISRVLRKTRPQLHFHGHYHVPMEWNNNGTYTYGLDREYTMHNHGVLNLETLMFNQIGQ